MNSSYKKFLNKNQLILSAFNINSFDNNYMIKMVTNNNISGLLSTRLDLLNSNPELAYDITSKHSLLSLLENQHIDYSLLSSLLINLFNTCEALEDYMLDNCFLLLSPEYIFFNPEDKTPFFCYCPIKENGLKYSLLSQMTLLLDYIITKLDYSDKDCVSVTYSLHQKCINNTFSIEDLLPDQKSNVQNNDIPKNVPEYNPDIIHAQTQLFCGSSDHISPESAPCVSENPTLILGLPPRLSLLLSALTIVLSASLLSSCYLYFITEKLSFYMFIAIIIISISIALLSFPFFINKRKYYAYLNDDHANNSADENMNSSSNEPISTIMPIGDTVLLSHEIKQPNPRLICSGTESPEQIDISSFPFTIGKLPESSDYIINNSLISRIHARFYFKDNAYYIEDLNSSNGTYINSVPISPHAMVEINDGDFITFARLTYIFKLS